MKTTLLILGIIAGIIATLIGFFTPSIICACCTDMPVPSAAEAARLNVFGLGYACAAAIASATILTLFVRINTHTK
jgi:predicted naringenin-chalcone synthase